MIEGTVVIARKRAAVLARQPLHVDQFAISKLPQKYMKTPMERSGDEHDLLAIWREPRLDVHATASG